MSFSFLPLPAGGVPVPEIPDKRAPAVRLIDGRPMASSLDVAAFFGKNHRNILRSIQRLRDNEIALSIELKIELNGEVATEPKNELSGKAVTELKNELSGKAVTEPKNGLSGKAVTELKNELSGKAVTELKNELSGEVATEPKNGLSGKAVTELKNELSGRTRLWRLMLFMFFS